MRIVFGAFLVAHGLVHMLYVAQSLRILELQPGMTWPDGAWALTWLIGDSAVRSVAGVVFTLVAAAFVVAGAAFVLRQAWGQPVAVYAAAVSCMGIALMWNGRLQGLDNQGLFAVLIDAGVLIAILAFHWPEVAA